MTKLVLLLSFSFVASFVQAQQTANNQGVIESPSAVVSGIGFISGWKCNSNDIELRLTGAEREGVLTLNPAQNMPRSDTAGVCWGEEDNGWIIQVNWNDLIGYDRVIARDNGEEFASADFSIGHTGEGFLRGFEGARTKMDDFPYPGQTTSFAWSTATQHWEIVETTGFREDTAWNPWGSIPEITIEKRVTAGTQPLPQYQSLMDWPQKGSEGCCVSVSMIFEPGDWMFLRNSSKGTVLIPHDEILAKRGEIDRIALRGPWMQHYNILVFNLIGIGIEPLFVISAGGDHGARIQTVSNDPKLFPYIPPDVTLPVEQTIYRKLKNDLGVGIPRLFLFLNSETGEFGYRVGMDGVPDEWYFPNNGRGPWRLVGTNNLTEGNAIVDIGQPILYFPPTQTVVRANAYRSFDDKPIAIAYNEDRRFARDDLRGTGKLEIINMTDYLYDYWVNPPDPSETRFTDAPVVYRSAATE